jgi:3-deoxy-D-manno-octulosonate 8-phosphate phosphatase (KDO 8-P phosphatase)
MSEDSEILRFDVKDGAALSMAIRAGYPVALISGRDSAVAKRRAKMLNISHVLTGVSDKRAALVGLMEKLRLETSQVMFMGDDILDLPAFDVAGFKACPADAAEDVVSRATYRCSHRGGRGAVREIVEMVMRAQGTWQAAIERIVNESSPVVQ